MAVRGHTGYTVTVVPVDSEAKVFCWGIRPVCVPLSALPNLFNEIMEYSTDVKEQHGYWYDVPLQEVEQ